MDCCYAGYFLPVYNIKNAIRQLREYLLLLFTQFFHLVEDWFESLDVPGPFFKNTLWTAANAEQLVSTGVLSR
jgi:hypothetical protein